MLPIYLIVIGLICLALYSLMRRRGFEEPSNSPAVVPQAKFAWHYSRRHNWRRSPIVNERGGQLVLAVVNRRDEPYYIRRTPRPFHVYTV